MTEKKKKGGCLKTGLILFAIIIAIGFAISTSSESDKSNLETTKTDLDTLSSTEKINNSLDVIYQNLNTEVKPSELNPQQLITLIKGSKLVIQKGLNIDTDTIKIKSEKVKNELVKFQDKNFPILRRKYIEEMDNKLWENNIDITCINKSCTEINVVGGAFASNKNIKEFYNTMYNSLYDLRFKKVNFKWIKSESEWTYFDVGSPKDSEF